MKAIAIRQVEGKPGEVYYPLQTLEQAKPAAGGNTVVVRVHAAALNHRDLFIRRHQYPGTAFGVALLADGCGRVEDAAGPAAAAAWRGRRVVPCPGRGWAAAKAGPEEAYAIMGGTRHYPTGMLAEFVALDAGALEEAPAHLTDAEAAALPLCGLTAWRAVTTKGRVARGDTVLVTGIGGGVALAALAFCVALGATVYVTSGDAAKLERARALGAAGGVNYRDADWERQLKALLPAARPAVDVVVDGAGGDVVRRAVAFLKPGGRIVSYGMTLGPTMDYSMQAVLRNIDVLGSTMGSRDEFRAMVRFVAEKRVRPVVSRVAEGLDEAAVDGLFRDMAEGRQFGKLVVRIADDKASKL